MQSPLFMAMHDPVLHRFISYLAEKKAELEHSRDSHIRIELSRSFVRDVRHAFRSNMLEGERHLHTLAHVLASKMFPEGFELHSTVIGLLEGDDRPFVIRERIDRDLLFSNLDIDLGKQMLDNFRYNKEELWVPLELSANFVEYIPVADRGSGVNRITSRVKAEEEIWNKVADELFHLDQLVSRDKHLRQFSKYVKDIFGIKIVCEDDATCLRVHDEIHHIRLQTPDANNGGHFEEPLEFVETKDYLTCAPHQMKRTGWKAIKSVVTWQSGLFEIQVQPLSNYYLELDHMSGPSHSSFKLKRDALRDEVTKVIPLYGFYRDLLKMIFKDGDMSFENEHASVVITDD